MIDRETEHIHIFARSIDGAEYINALYDNDIDAALDFLGLYQSINKYNEDAPNMTIEDVVNSLREERKGIYGGMPGLVVFLSKCGGGCISPNWN